MSTNLFANQLEVLAELEPEVALLIEKHEDKRSMWFSSEILTTFEDDNLSELISLRERAKSIPDNARVSLALNLLTEEGLPHFHRLLAQALGTNSFWAQWNFLWTAEEDRHGNIIRDYCRDSNLLDFKALERAQFDYIRKGFTPSWTGNPYKTFVYTSAQERATQISHEATAKLIGDNEPTITNILKKISSEEARHFVFYMTVFKEILKRDPNGALEAACDVLPSIDMPGVSVKNFAEYAEVIMRSGGYSMQDYKVIVEQLISQWRVEAVTGLNEMGRKAQEKIMAIPTRLDRVIKLIESRIKTKTFNFDVIFNRELMLDINK